MTSISKVTSVALVAMAMAVVSNAEEQKAPAVSGTLTLETYSKYVWRGLNSNDDFVLWPCLTVAYGPWSAYVFGNLELTNANSYGPTPQPSGEFTEYDLNITYTGKYKNVPFTLGAVQYVYPKTGSAQTGELYATVTAPVPGSPTLSAYYDYELVHGFYVALSGSYPVGKVVNVPVNATASFGYGDRNHNAYYYGYSSDSLADGSLLLNAAFPIGKGMTLTPSIKYTTLLDNNLLKGSSKRENVIFGLSFNYSF